MTAAIYFEPDAFITEGRQMMGRRAAGTSFLRAVVEGRGSEPVIAYTRTETARAAFLKAVRDLDPAAGAQCIGAGSLDQLTRCGTLWRPDPMIAADTRLRLRNGAASYSICGITHTISSAGILDGFGQLVGEPVMEWDAIICTSTVARQTIQTSMDAAWEQLHWLTGGRRRVPSLQLPIIPLGVHCADWLQLGEQRSEARSRLGIAEEDVTLLFAGRLSYAGKAHPYQMFEALQAVSQRTQRKLTLILSGQYLLDHVQNAFEEAASRLCPDVRFIHVDGADADEYGQSFAAADIFISLADSHQETFGITPIEAMASGLPVIVTDWNGYRDTVRDGVDGFRIPTWAPAPGAGHDAARFYESTGAFETYSAWVSGAVSVDSGVLVERLSALAMDAELRRKLGAAGQRRARETYDWSVIYPRYAELWLELEKIRQTAGRNPAITALLKAAPRSHHGWPDPFDRFACFPTHHIGPESIVGRIVSARADYTEVSSLAMFRHVQFAPAIADGILRALDREPTTVNDLAGQVRLSVPLLCELLGRLAKMGLVELA